MTIKDIAKICGVSISTVSRAINDHPDINEKTKRHITSIIKEYNYSPNTNARNLKIIESHTIAILIKGITNSFFTSMIKVFEKEIYKKKYNFLLHRVEEDEDEIDVALTLKKEKKINGIIFLGGYFSKVEEKINKLDLPFILSTGGIADENSKDNFSYVMVDDYSESYKIVDYLCKIGHKRIGIICAPPKEESIGKFRLEGYRSALKKNKIKLDESLIYFDEYKDVETFSMEYGYKVAEKIISEKTKCTAIFAISDTIAIGACKAIFNAGYKVPEDYSIVGYDGIDLSYYFEPSITTIKQPTVEIAEETIKILFDMINGEVIKSSKILQGELIKGKSVKELI